MAGQNSASVIFNIFYSEAQEPVFWIASCNCLILPLKKSYSWHTNEKVRYKGDVTVVIHTLFLFLALGKVLMIETLQRFYWHEQHMFKVDPNFSIARLSHLHSQIFILSENIKLIIRKQ
jgi:hypothetical protein